MEKPQYPAFISYRHADNREEGRCWATWLHRTLETYVVPPELVGTDNLRGQPVPARIYPVFRDEEEFSAEAALAPAICDALERSQTLIVLCSPRAVQSPYVAAEISHFRSLGRADRIVPALLDGEPGHATLEAFPAPLRETLGTDGHSSNEPLAADFRLPDATQGYTDPVLYERLLRGRGDLSASERARMAAAYREKSQLAFLKLVAAVLAVPLATLTKRDQAYQLLLARKRARIFRAVAAALSVLLALAVLSGLYANRKRIEAVKARDSANGLVTFMLTDLHDQLSETGRLDVLSSAVQRVDAHLVDNPVPPDLVADLRLQQARILFGQGRLAQAVERVKRSLQELPENTTSKAHRARLHAFMGDVLAWERDQNEAARKECLTALGLFDTSQADPAAVEAWVRTQIALGDILRDDQRVPDAQLAYESAWTLAARHAPQLDGIHVLARQHHAEICFWHNQTDAASTSVAEALSITQKHLDQAPNSHPWLVVQAETWMIRSAMEMYSGRLAQSLESLRKAETNAEQTATPGQLHRQFLLASIRSQIAAHPSPILTLPQRAQLFAAAVQTQRALIREAPGNRSWAAKLASTLRDHSTFQLELGDLFQDDSFQLTASADLQEAELLLRPVQASGLQREYIETLLKLAPLLPPQEQAGHISKARLLLDQLPPQDIETLQLKAQLILLTSDDEAGSAQAHALILQAWTQAEGIRKNNLADHLASSHERLAAFAVERKDSARYSEEAEKALHIRRQSLIPGADQPDVREKLALALSSHARSLRDLGDSEQARQSYEEAARLFQALMHGYPSHAPPWRELALAQYQLAKLHGNSQQAAQALALYQTAFSTYLAFIEKASLEVPQPPPPMRAANLTTLAAIAGREAETATSAGNDAQAAAAWTRLFKATARLDAAQLPASEAEEVLAITAKSLTGTFEALKKLPAWPAEQDADVRAILSALQKTQPEVSRSPEFLELQKRLEQRR